MVRYRAARLAPRTTAQSVYSDRVPYSSLISARARIFPREELPFVKEKFFKGSARGRGAGIGLAVCNEIIGMHGGTLDIDSVYGEAATQSLQKGRVQYTEDGFFRLTREGMDLMNAVLLDFM